MAITPAQGGPDATHIPDGTLHPWAEDLDRVWHKRPPNDEWTPIAEQSDGVPAVRTICGRGVHSVHCSDSKPPPGEGAICGVCEAADAVAAERDRYKQAAIAIEHNVQQILGRALGYPQYGPDSGISVGEHTAATLAREAATRIAEADRWEYGLRPRGSGSAIPQTDEATARLRSAPGNRVGWRLSRRRIGEWVDVQGDAEGEK